MVRRGDLAHDLREEMDAHFDMEVQSHVDRGLSPEQARERAHRTFGNRTLMSEASREAWTFPRFETLLQDLRYGVRLLRRSPGFAFTAVAVMALGVGASAAAFTLLDHVLLRPLPFASPERIVMLYETQLANGVARTQTSPPNFLDWRAMSQSFEVMGGYISIRFPMNLSGHGEPVRIDTAVVESDVFRTLGVQPAAGRMLSDDDDRVGAPDVVVLSHALASALFGGVQAAVGQTISLDDQTHSIVGVMPAGFAFPTPDAQLWRSLRFTPPMLSLRNNHLLYAIARLRPGVSIEQARADMDVIAARLQRAYPKENARSGIGVADLRDTISPVSRTLVIGVFGAALCLMLIACTNLANLLFARAIARRHEMAVRAAIGAGRGRLLRQLLTESVILAGLGGAAGLLVALVGTPLLARLVPAGLPIGSSPVVDWRVFGFAAALTVATSVIFGVAPALDSSRRAEVDALRSRTAIGRSTERLRAALVVAEVVGAVMLIVGAGLLVKALWRVQAKDPGFRSAGVLTLRTALPVPRYASAAARRDFYQRILANTRELSGVESAAYTSYHPMEMASGRLPITVPGIADDPVTAPEAVIHFVTPGFFATLGIPLRAGRDIDERDTGDTAAVAVISESLARRLWPDQDAVGRQLKALGRDRTVIAVAADTSVRALEGVSDAQIYFPAEQLGGTSSYYAPKDLLVRTSGDPLALAPAVRKIVRDVDPAQAVSDVRPLSDILALQTAPRRDQLVVLGSFTAVAFLLAAIGIHGLLSFTVSARTQEVGVRVALGAERSTILQMFLRQGLVLGLAGVALAIPLAYAAARAMRALLSGVEPGDPLIYSVAIVLALLMTLAGSLRPALHAATIDPATTIRTE